MGSAISNDVVSVLLTTVKECLFIVILVLFIIKHTPPEMIFDDIAGWDNHVTDPSIFYYSYICKGPFFNFDMFSLFFVEF